MGTDINLIAEKRTGDGWNILSVPRAWAETSWHFKSGHGLCLSCDEEENDEDGNCIWCDSSEIGYRTWYQDRNYALYGILAGVRSELPPIASLRGIPDDLSPQAQLFKLNKDPDAFGISWYLLSELLDFDWNQISERKFVVTEHEYRRMKAAGESQPQEYCAWVSGPGLEIVSPIEMEQIIEKNVSSTTSYFTQVTWTEKYSELCERFLNMLDELKKLGEPNEIRIVFWFD